MKNLFDFATKELSQDAFLRWLFENYNCENESVRNAFKKLFEAFTGIDPNKSEITELETVAQWKNIDASIWVKIDGEEHLIVIEDKTTSGLHGNQLEKYDNKIKVHNEYWIKQQEKGNKKTERFVKDKKNIHRVFYKTSKTNETGWGRSFQIEQIYELFKDVRNTGSEILDSYAEHIREIYSACYNSEKPQEHNNSIDLFKWEAYFKNTVIPNLTQNGYKVGAWKAGPYPYICLVVKKLDCKEEIPYLEIRSRDCLHNNFAARVLLYEVKRTESQLEKLKANIQTSDFKAQNHKQQVGITPETETAQTDEEFISLVEKYANEYLKVMKDW